MTAPLWGALPSEGGEWRFGLWAPSAADVALRLDRTLHPMTRGSDGAWQITCPARANLPYMFRVDGTDYPDPASRLQLDGPEGPSLTVDPSQFDWGSHWQGRPFEEAVIFELHIGTFTTEGTFEAATHRLADLAAMGVTVIELMPVSQFSGARGWGYDGVLIRAPQPDYGSPDAMRTFVRTAQQLGMAVLLDLVMNHFGPFGNLLPAYVPEMFSDRATPWGAAIDFARPQVQAFFHEAAMGWLHDYRLDGFRFDAVHQIRDGRNQQVMRDLARDLRASAPDRPLHLICEDERNLPSLRENGYDAEWNDDWHNALHVALTGERQGYYSRFANAPFDHLARAMARAQVDEGQPSPEEPRGAPSAHLPWTAFINSNLTHDQVGNRAHGERLISLVGETPARVIHAALLLMPFAPMLFMGEEEGSTAPFHFFCDPPDDDSCEAVRKGRRAELAGIGYEVDGMLDPCGEAAFAVSRPYPAEDPDRATAWRDLTRRLIDLRMAHIVPLLRSGKIGDGTVSRPTARSFDAAWRFEGGTLRVRLALGTPLGAVEGTPIFTMGDLARDAFALHVEITS